MNNGSLPQERTVKTASPTGFIGSALWALAVSLLISPLSVAQTPTQETKAQQNLADERRLSDKDFPIDRLQTFAQAFAIVRNHYVEPVTDQDLIEGALNGALARLDPHSSYVSKQVFKDQQKSSRREYGGLGIEVTQEKGLVKVNYVTPDGPAARAGIQSGDYITAVEGEKTLGKSLGEAVKGMRGLAGDAITLTLLSPNQDPRDMTLTREVILGRAVRHRVEDGLAYIFIETFTHPRLDKDFKIALDTLKQELGGHIPGLIIDLRGNRGGLLTQSVNISGFFLDGGEVLSARGRTPADTERYHAKPGELLADVPLVILINSGSASAAEIVAGAIQDRGRGLIVGRRSFGKGSVQSIIPLANGGGALRMTTQRYYTPSGRSIQGQGILPDVSVAFRPDTGKSSERFREDSFPNALTNASQTVDYKEDPDKVLYPPPDWPKNKDYQLDQAKLLLKSPRRYHRLLRAQNELGLKSHQTAKINRHMQASSRP